MSQTRQLAAIMFTDIVGYTALMGQDSNKALELVRQSKEIQKPLVEKHNGKWLKEMGDGAMAQFSTALDAVNCSIEIQEIARGKLDAKLRIGIHLGDVTVEEHDVHGDGVNVASRLEAIADAGGIYISESIEKAIQGQSDVQAKYLGMVKLKNVAYGVRIYALQGGGLPVPEVKANKRVYGYFIIAGLVLVILVMYAYPRFFTSGSDNSAESATNPPANSIAVLYFDNMSGDSLSYFSDGLTEEIISTLSKIDGLKVRSRTSVKQYRQSSGSLSMIEIAEDLNVAAILEGSIRRFGNQIRITAQLINGKTDEHFWSKDFDFIVENNFEIQLTVAREIANQFDIEITPEIDIKINTPITQNSKAYDLYLKARFIAHKDFGIGNESVQIRNAAKYLRKAIELDPDFIEAYSLLSEVYYILGAVDNTELLRDSALILANLIITLDSSNPAGYMALADIYFYMDLVDSVEKMILKANQLDPEVGLLRLASFYLWNKNNLPKSMGSYSSYIQTHPQELDGYIGKLRIYAALGLDDSVTSLIKRIRDIDSKFDPTTKLSWFNYYLPKGDFESVLSIIEREYGYDSLNRNYLLGILHMYKREFDVSLEYFLMSRYQGMDKGLAYQKLGMKDSALRIFDNHLRLITIDGDSNSFGNNHDAARIYSAMGENEKAIKLLYKLIDESWNVYYLIHNCPYLDYLKDNQDFIDFMNYYDKVNRETIKEVLKQDKYY